MNGHAGQQALDSTLKTNKGQGLHLPLLLLPLWQKNERYYCPDAKGETKNGPEVFRVAVITGE